MKRAATHHVSRVNSATLCHQRKLLRALLASARDQYRLPAKRCLRDVQTQG
ncbi:MAG: hypothetical protein JRE43_10450 [Deltaproteobacteria bacterium]|nr:hypothetical protein [Deltaproteobacteria bacterium]